MKTIDRTNEKRSIELINESSDKRPTERINESSHKRPTERINESSNNPTLICNPIRVGEKHVDILSYKTK